MCDSGVDSNCECGCAKCDVHTHPDEIADSPDFASSPESVVIEPKN